MAPCGQTFVVMETDEHGKIVAKHLINLVRVPIFDRLGIRFRIQRVVPSGLINILRNFWCDFDVEVIEYLEKRDCALEDAQIDLQYVNSSSSYHKICTYQN
jgi:hypothetical protein